MSKTRHDYQWISKHDPRIRQYYEELISFLSKLHRELYDEFTFQHKIIGSYRSNTMTYDDQ